VSEGSCCHCGRKTGGRIIEAREKPKWLCAACRAKRQQLLKEFDSKYKEQSDA
jgi:hypothetical protein